MKRPYLPLPVVQAATTKIKTTLNIAKLYKYFDPRKLPAIYGIAINLNL